MRLPDEPDLPPQINIVPMIDVIFAILTFFIMSTLFLTRSEGLPVNLPKATTAKQQVAAAGEQVTVTVDAKGEISLNSQPVALDNLQESVRSLIGNKEGTLVILSADRAINHGRVIAVMDRLRQIEGVQLAIQTEK